jgi:hypothetical protein
MRFLADIRIEKDRGQGALMRLTAARDINTDDYIN